MKKAQGLPLNLIVIGALALLVLMILGGVLIMGGGSMMQGLTGMAPEEEEVAIQSLLNTCQSRCRSADLLINSLPPANKAQLPRLYDFCCYGSEINSDGTVELGTESCAALYTDCRIADAIPSVACKGRYGSASYDFTPTPESVTFTCEIGISSAASTPSAS